MDRLIFHNLMTLFLLLLIRGVLLGIIDLVHIELYIINHLFSRSTKYDDREQ